MEVKLETRLNITLDNFRAVVDLKTILEHYLSDEENSEDVADTAQTMLDALQ